VTRRTKPPGKSPHGSRHHPDGPNQCGPNCQRPTRSQAHCAARGCHRTFGGVGNFDRHRRDGKCLLPSELGMVLKQGIWRVPMSDRARLRLSHHAD
jgi:hypothetical protein